MMENWKDGLHAALLRYIRDDLGCSDAVEVTEYTQEVSENWGCQTCGGNWNISVDIWYRKADGKTDLVTYDGDLGGLIERIT